MQTKKNSFIESVTQTVIGFCIAMLTQIIVYPIMDISVTIAQNFKISAIFTVVSIIRGYLIRRIFNKL